MFEWRIDTLTFSSGDEIPIEPGSTLIIIGPNNSGKSKALREIERLIEDPESDTKVVQKIIHSHNDPTSLIYWFKKYYSSPSRKESQFITKNHSLQIDRLVKITNNFTQGKILNELVPFLCHRLDTESRLQLGNPIQSINVYSQTPSNYLNVARNLQDQAESYT